MESPEDRIAPRAEPGLYHFLRRTLSRLRWGTLAVLLLISLAQPATGRGGLPDWALVALFAAYNLLIELLRIRLTWLRSFAWVALFDLPVAGVLYFVSAEPGGPLFVLFFLAVDTAAASMSLRGTLFYTTSAAVTAAAIDPTLAMWSPTMGSVRMLAARLITLALIGLGMAIVTRRLTLEHEAAQTEQDEAGRLGELGQLRSRFIASVSHDLRTPLTAAWAALGLLERSATDRLEPDERNLLDNGRRNIERLTVLIGDLLAYNQLEARALQLEREPLDLRATAIDAMAEVHPLLREKGQTLEVDMPEPLLTVGDPRRLEQVLVDLLANAHHHTPAGTRISLSGRLSGDAVLLDIGDNGPGVPAEELEAIFQRFYRLTPGDGGSGLGLAIARALVELHGGRISAESALGQGTTFHVSLPRAVSGDRPASNDGLHLP